MPKYADPAVYPVGTPAATDNVMTRTAAGADGNFALGNLAGIAGLTAATDLSLYYTGSAWATYTVTSVGRTLLAATTQAAQRTALGAADDTAVVHTTGNETIGGLKLFTGSSLRMQGTAPGFWQDETDGSFGMYTVLDAGNFQIQQRDAGFGGNAVIRFFINLATSQSAIDYNFGPRLTNTYTCGTATRLWTQIFATNATINTSDARLKTEPRQQTAAERKAGSALARLPAIWEWLTGDRLHAGPTVQAAMAVMEAHGLDPFAYSFICYDEWEAEEATYDDEGNELSKAVEAGNRYSFRKEELLCFMVSALAAENDLQAAKVEALDARLAALEAKA